MRKHMTICQGRTKDLEAKRGYRCICSKQEAKIIPIVVLGIKVGTQDFICVFCIYNKHISLMSLYSYTKRKVATLSEEHI